MSCLAVHISLFQRPSAGVTAIHQPNGDAQVPACRHSACFGDIVTQPPKSGTAVLSREATLRCRPATVTREADFHVRSTP